MLPPMLATETIKQSYRVQLREAQMHRLVKEARTDRPTLLQRAQQVLQRKPQGRSRRATQQLEAKLSMEK